MLARMFIEDTFLAALPEMATHGFELNGDSKLVGMSWSDNVFTFASTVEDACMVMDLILGILSWAYVWTSLEGNVTRSHRIQLFFVCKVIVQA